MAAVRLENVEKIYPNGFKAVHGVNIDIKDGEFMVMVGPSGCAKTTCLRMIAGLEEVSSGKVTIGNKIVNDLAPKDRGIAMVFQNYALYPHMSVYENMAFGLRLKKLSKKEIDERVRNAAKQLEITELLDKKPKVMSGGQRQRVALGRALVRKPDVFLFDEPLSNLDAKLRVSMRVKIVQLHQKLKQEGQNATMVYVTHDQVEAMTMGDRICVLKDGKVMQIDTPINLYEKPANKFVAGFIGSPAMNQFESELILKNSKLYVKVENIEVQVPEDKASQIMNFYKDTLPEKIWFGIRPEGIELADEKSTNSLESQITLLENMGNETFCYFNFLNKRYISRHSSTMLADYKINDACYFTFNMKKSHFFDINTEANIIYT